MEKVYDSEYLMAMFDEENSFLKLKWKPTSSKLTDEKYKQEILSYAQYVEKFKPDRILADMKNFSYTIPRETQVWTDEVTSKIYEEYVLRKAIIVSDNYEEFYLSEDENEYEDVSFNFEYFDNEEGAINWLNMN